MSESSKEMVIFLDIYKSFSQVVSEGLRTKSSTGIIYALYYSVYKPSYTYPEIDESDSYS